MKSVASILSYASHPLFVLTYGLWILIATDPHSFGVTDVTGELPLLVLTFVYTALFPIITILVMRLLGFINGLELETRQERIGPLIATIVFYTWMYVNVRNNPDVPDPFSLFCLGSVISLSLAFMVNVFDKISLHAVGLGGLAFFLFLLLDQFKYQWIYFGGFVLQLVVLLIAIILLAGVVGVARVLLGAHHSAQFYGGFLVGIMGQVFAWRFLL